MLVCAINLIEAIPATTDKYSDIQASKAVKDAKQQALDKKKSGKACSTVCTTEYAPVCAHDPTAADSKSTLKAFANACVLSVHNCEQGSSLVVKSQGLCPGSTSVRLS
ncbi:hypothetical protein QAD02_017694 [Eretmocerus hayati]|uniref:Uncharacterized protein n=1 Tax=Eretmocerus hayati TaxID=131215 RepID=A0ACC2PEM1_9HYME|nr:hypothetical protein QAD02_017694 [Eretmocerus hayati]